MLTIAPNLKLPIETVTQTFAILAKRGVGKTHCAVVMTEELLKAGQRVVVVDPVGVWSGLRSSKDGKSPGQSIVILGGDHADAPLEITGGAVVADLVVDERLSVILDLSRFRKGEQVRFMTDFCERLYLRNRDPLHIMMDEADAFAPQRPMRGEERLLGAVEDLVRRGRARGIGLTLITQRSAVLNKNVLSQVEVLVSLRTIAPQDRDAIDAWIQVHGTPEQRRELLASLPSLAIGEAWFWSPGWLDIFRRVKVRDRETFDSSATPKVGQTIRAPKQMAAVDLEALRVRMAATIEKAKADDPKALRARIVELERAMKTQQKPLMVDREAVTEAVNHAVWGLQTTIKKKIAEALAEVEKLNGILASLSEFAGQYRSTGAIERALRPAETARPARSPVAWTGKATAAAGAGKASMPRAQRQILSVLAHYPEGRNDVQVAIMAGYSSKGGGYRNALSGLRTSGLITGGNDRLVITDAGREAIGPIDPLPSGDELLAYWMGQLPKCERAILEFLVRQAGDLAQPITNVAAATGYEPNGGGFRNALSKLRTLELITGRNEVQAADIFFDELFHK